MAEEAETAHDALLDVVCAVYEAVEEHPGFGLGPPAVVVAQVRERVGELSAVLRAARILRAEVRAAEEGSSWYTRERRIAEAGSVLDEALAAIARRAAL